MVKHPLVRPALGIPVYIYTYVFAALGAAIGTVGARPAPLGAQAAPRTSTEVRVGVRPARIRLGETLVVTVRVVSPRWPDEVSLEPGEGAEIVEVRDRTSGGVGTGGLVSMVLERDFLVRPRAVGRLLLTPVVVAFGETRVERPVPEIEVLDAGLAWVMPPSGRPEATQDARRDPRPAAPRDEGRPPDPTGRNAVIPAPSARDRRTAVVDPSERPTYATGSTAAGAWSAVVDDPTAWEELVPRLITYDRRTDDPNGLARLEGGVVPRRAYVGQQVTVVATATFPPEAAARMGTSPEFVAPRAGDAISVDLPWAPSIPAAANGRSEEAHSFMRAFFPVRPGTLAIQGPTLLYSVGSAGRGRPPLDTLALGPLSVEVVPVPRAQAPAAWTGAVGRYAVTAYLSASDVVVGEAAVLTVEVSGIGYLPEVGRPRLAPLRGAELRPTGERSEVEIRDGVVGGTKSFAWLVVPVEPGALQLGPVVFPYFDPWVGAFGQAFSNGLVLRVGLR